MKRLAPPIALAVVLAPALPARADEAPMSEAGKACSAKHEATQAQTGAAELIEQRKRALACVVECSKAVPEGQEWLALESLCKRLLADLKTRIPKVTFAAITPSGDETADVRVSVDGKPKFEKLPPLATELNPGAYKFVFTHADARPVEKTLVIRESENRTVQIKFEALAAEGPPSTSASPTAAPVVPGAPADAPVAASSSWSTVRTAGLVTGAVGLVGIGVGAALGASANSKNAASEERCDMNVTPHECDAEGGQLRGDAQSLGGIATAAFIIGGAAVVGGATMFLLGGNDTEPAAESASTASLRVHVSPAGVMLKGAW